MIKLLLAIIFACVWFLFSLITAYVNEDIYDQTYIEYDDYSPKYRTFHFVKLMFEGPFILLRLLKKK